MKKNLYTISCVFFFAITAMVTMEPLYAEHTQEDFATISAHARTLWNKLEDSNAGPVSMHANEAGDSVRGVLRGGVTGTGVVAYLHVRVTVRDHQQLLLDAFHDVAISVCYAPESVLAMLEVQPVQKRRRYAALLAKMIPLSVWTREMDAGNSAFLADIYPARPGVPHIDRQKMLQVAHLFEIAQLHDLAWRAYAEAIYATFVPAWTLEPGLAQTWLSPEAAQYWYEAATSARFAGKRDIAGAYLMKAAVFGDDELYKKTQITAKRWAAEDAGQVKPPKPEPVDPAVKREALTKVVHIYMQMNAHPRAWALIDAHRNAFENPDKLRKAVEEDWLAVVKNVSRAATKVTLYGHEVYPHGDPMDVTIPWALSDEAIASVQKRLQKDKESLRASN